MGHKRLKASGLEDQERTGPGVTSGLPPQKPLSSQLAPSASLYREAACQERLESGSLTGASWNSEP